MQMHYDGVEAVGRFGFWWLVAMQTDGDWERGVGGMEVVRFVWCGKVAHVWMTFTTCR